MEEKLFARGVNYEFVDFYKRYFAEVYKYIYRRIENRQIAEDIAQETFYIAYVRWREVEEHPTPQGWLLQTAYFKMLEVNRRIYRHSEIPLEEAPEDVGNDETNYGLRELEMAALEILESEEWNLVKKHYFLGYTVRDLASREGVTENNLRVRLSRILKKLRSALGG